MAVTRVNGQKIIHMTAAADVIATEWFHISKIIWSDFTNANHQLVVKNGAGEVVLTIEAGATTGHHNIDFAPSLKVQGLETDALGSGTVDYYTE